MSPPDLWPISELHGILLRLAGRMPDDWMIELRRMLGGGEIGYLPDTISGGVATLAVSMTPEDIALLRRIQSGIAGARAPAGIDLIPVVAQLPPTTYRFAQSRYGEPVETDTHDDSAEVVGTTEPAVVELRRTWRTDPTGAVGATRIYLVEVDPDAYAPAISEDIANMLDWSQEQPPPQIEVYRTGEDLPSYHLAALAGSMLIWQRPDGAAAAPAVAETSEPGRDLVEQLVDAAWHGRFDDMRRLIDWPLTGAPRVALQLAAIDPDDREFYARGLVPGLFTAADSPDRVRRVLWQVKELVGLHPRVHRPGPEERAEILDQLRVPEVPEDGLGADLLAQLAELRRRSAELSEVFLVRDGPRVFPLVWAPDSDRLVLFYE